MLAWRYLNPRRAILSSITLICLSGVVLGVAVLVVVMAVMAGLEREVKARVLGFSPHLKIEAFPGGAWMPTGDWRSVADKVKAVPGVEAAAPFLQDNMIVDHNGAQIPLMFRAVDTKDTTQIKGIEDMLDRTEYPDSSADMGLDNFVVISSQSAKSLGVGPGDMLRLYSTRNFQNVMPVVEAVNRPLVREEFADQLAEANKLLEVKKDERGRLVIPIEAFNRAYNQLLLPIQIQAAGDPQTGVSSKPIRKPEQALVERALEALYFIWENHKDEAAGVYVIPKEQQEQFQSALKELGEADRDKMDGKAWGSLKEVILPKEVKIIGVYMTSQRVLAPDLFVPIPLGQELSNLGDAVQAVAVRVQDPYKAGLYRNDVQKVMGDDWQVSTWMDLQGDMYSMIARERVMMSFVLSFIILICAFAMSAVMFTNTMQKKREIGVMKALGATQGQIVRVFLYQGVLLGILGAISGIGLGRLILHYRDSILSAMRSVGFDPFPASIQGFDQMPVMIKNDEHLVIAIGSFLLCVAAAWLPARAVARSEPAKALRNL